MKLQNTKGYISRETFLFLENIIIRKKNLSNVILQLISDLIRFNTILSVARAGTGHLGASLSMVEILTEIYFRTFKISKINFNSPVRNIFILSKGHGAPSLYAILAAKGFIKTEMLDRLRRYNGLSGHCDIKTYGIEANTGSLSMGLSKAVGHALFKKRNKLTGKVLVVVGDGELQEGQCWEALLSAVSNGLDNLIIIVDVNEVQTDQYTKNIVKYNDLVETFKSMGFLVKDGSGKDIVSVYKAFQFLQKVKIKPQIFFAHTIKGQGVSYMEHLNILKNKNSRYTWHNKAPNLEQLRSALNEILNRNKNLLSKLNLEYNLESAVNYIPIEPIKKDMKGDNLIEGFSKSLDEVARKNNKIVVFDGDLEEDCGLVKFHRKYPLRFFELGIMEQHMVSSASSFSRYGYIPIICTYTTFLTSRANEQIYNLTSENGKALIVGFMSGIIPATSGKSHQGFRDIGCIKNIPGITIFQPINSKDIRNFLNCFTLGKIGKIAYLRLSMATSDMRLPNIKNIKKGLPQLIKKGKDVILISLGPVLLSECLKASEILIRENINVEVWNFPWILNFDKKILINFKKRKIPVIIIEDHYIHGGLADSLLTYAYKQNIFIQNIKHMALNYFPETGFREEALKSCGLDTNSIVRNIRNILLNN